MGNEAIKGKQVRLFEGRFGRLVLTELTPQDELQALADPAIVMAQGDGEVRFLNPGEIHVNVDATRALVFHAASEWLRQSFPAAFGAGERAFPEPREPITPRIRRLADALAVQALNDRFLSHERLEFMLEEVVLSVLAHYLPRPLASSPPWLRARPQGRRSRRA